MHGLARTWDGGDKDIIYYNVEDQPIGESATKMQSWILKIILESR